MSRRGPTPWPCVPRQAVVAICGAVCKNVMRLRLETRAAGRHPEHVMTRDKTNYAERRSGELLPRRAREYLPPHVVPSRPDARTMENESIRLSPELDPRNARTQLSMRAIRSERRVWAGLLAGVTLGSLLGGAMWLLEDGVQSRVTAPSHDETAVAGSSPTLYEPQVLPVQTAREPIVEVIDEGDVEDEVADERHLQAPSEVRSDRAVVRAGRAADSPPAAAVKPKTTAVGARPSRVAEPAEPKVAEPKVEASEPPQQNGVWVKSKSERKVWLK